MHRMKFHYYNKIVIKRVITINNKEKAAEAFANWSSMPFLPKNVSAPPLMEPDKPALRPDCSKTVAITPRQQIICTMRKIVNSTRHPPLIRKLIDYKSIIKNDSISPIKVQELF